MGRLVICFFVAVTFFTCQHARPDSRTLRVSFSCEQAGIMVDPEVGDPGIYALVNEFKVKLAEWSDCRVLESAEFPAALPAATQAVVQGERYLLWATKTEAGVDFYTVRRAELAAADFSRIATYQDGRFELLRPLHPADLAGYYTHAAADTSYVLFVGMDGGRLISKLFATTEALPADKMLQRALPTFATTDELPLSYDINTLDFRGPLGRGHVHWHPDSVQLRFEEFLGQTRSLDFVALR